LCIPAVNVAWLIRVIWLASWGGVLPVMGAAPAETALFTPASSAVLSGAGARRASWLAAWC